MNRNLRLKIAAFLAQKMMFPTILAISFAVVGALSAADSNGSNNLAEPIGETSGSLRRLDPTDPIWVSSDRTRVLLLGKICLREGSLEFFACRKNSKEHESVIALDVKPYLIHAALLVIGAQKGSTVRFNPVFVPPSGEEIDLRVRWVDPVSGQTHEIVGQEMIRRVDTGETMKSPWVFTGGLTDKDQQGRSFYTADITGEIIGVSNFVGTVLDVPFESSSDNDNLIFEPFTERIPEVGTDVTLILSRAKKETAPSDEKSDSTP